MHACMLHSQPHACTLILYKVQANGLAWICNGAHTQCNAHSWVRKCVCVHALSVYKKMHMLMKLLALQYRQWLLLHMCSNVRIKVKPSALFVWRHVWCMVLVVSSLF